ncbi:hypothetical protein [Phenylobacterium sp.]|uniref:hypothetical protein n=1 Tax=Phenylobacterium sp. TaxID=1871053 RepID=UPI002FD8877D
MLLAEIHGHDAAMQVTINRLRKGGGSVAAVVLALVGMGGPEAAIGALRDTINFLLAGTGYEAPAWISVGALAKPFRYACFAAAMAVLIWAFWPIITALRLYRPRNAQTSPSHTSYGRFDRPQAYRSYVVGGRAQEGTTTGPMPLHDAINIWREENPDFLPLEDAARWLYDNASPSLRDILKDYRPFGSIVEHAKALVGAAADEGICELWASREAGLSPETVKYEELTDTAIEAAFGRERPKPVNPMVRRGDLLKVLEHYETPPPPAPAKIKRDTP